MSFAVSTSDLQARCEHGQSLLMATEYLRAEEVLAGVERDAWEAGDFDTLSRLYMPLQEARRQRRQRCGDGIVCLDLIATGPNDILDARHVIENYPHGQLLVAGHQSIEPAAQVRRMAREHQLYLDTFLAASYDVGGGRAVVIVPAANVALPARAVDSIDELIGLSPPHSIVLSERELPSGSRRGTAQTFGQVMGLWERLHLPFLAAADMQADPIRKMEGYRAAIRVDYACELAHQKLSDVARSMLRK